MDFFISVASKGIIETLRERLAELELLACIMQRFDRYAAQNAAVA